MTPLGALLILAAPAAAPDDWWSLRPLAAPAPPREAADPWCRGEIDAFVLARLRAAGLEPSPEADRATLARRLTFDLHGLPPTPEEVEAFVRDPRPDAYERLVERLLASPRHAERQARRWLDVARYADTHGFDKDKRRPNAWPYRDWVVQAFEADLAWGEFVRLQVAGDVLDPGGPGVAATGFLAAGPWDFVGHVELREGTVDKAITRNLDRDEMTRAVLGAFASTTVGCARCHDHKFDAVRQQDYYALQAVFAGIERAEVPFDPGPEVAALRAQLQRLRAQATRELARLEADLAARTSPALETLDARLAGATRYALPDHLRAAAPDGAPRLGFHSQIAPTPEVAKWVQVDLGASQPFDQVVLWPAHEVFGEWDGPGFGFPPRFSVAVGDEPDLTDGRELLALRDADVPNPGDAPLVVNGDGRPARYVRLTAHRLWARRHSGTVDFALALAELSVRRGSEELALGRAVDALDSIEAGQRWGARLAVDGVVGGSTLAALEEIGGRDPVLLLLDPSTAAMGWARLAQARGRAWAAAVEPGDRARLGAARERLAEVDARLADLPAPRRVYAAAVDFASEGNFTPPGRPRPVHVLARGEVSEPGPAADPAPLPLPGLPASFGLEDGAPEGQRRLALAEWLTRPDHPLTWRSAANRLWQGHFGRGLVTTPSDFGRMGATPSHPLLLDWLAHRLRSGPQSTRALQRAIVTSATYRQASGGDAAREALDAQNRLLWRGPRTRLDAETLHDALLAVCGELDLSPGGPGFDRFAFEDDHSPRYLYERHDPAAPGAQRRALYRFVVRSVPDPWLATFDCPDPSQAAPARLGTTTPLQALALFNSPFALHAAERLAARCAGEAAGQAEQVARAWRLAVGRAPSASEQAALAAHAARRGLPATCRVILNSNAFLYVD